MQSAAADPFPPSFLWGAATAAFQIEGASAADGKGPSVWDQFSRIPGKMSDGVSGDPACDHYRRLDEDVALMRRLNLQSYRFSISWPRVLPAGRGSPNPAGLAFYDRLVDKLLDAGIDPFVTLYHWDLPQALQDDLGGWAHPDLASIFADYAGLVFDKLGDRVRCWVTLNEPWCVVDGGYFTGAHAPGLRDVPLGYRAGHNLLRAHAYAVARYRASSHGHGAISFALNTAYSFPASERHADVDAAERAVLNFGGWFTDPPYFGDYPAVMRERLGELLPAFSTQDAALLKGSMDFLALNYYTSDVIRHAPGMGTMEIEAVPQPHQPHTEMGWMVSPEGFQALLHWLHNRYSGLPIYITENGAACPDAPDADGYVDDQDRIAYLRTHLAAVRAAMAGGVDLRGYFAWTLMDNIEWSYGFTKRFGLIRCDPQTQKRTIKASGHWYADLIERGKLDAPLSPSAGRPVEVTA